MQKEDGQSAVLGESEYVFQFADALFHYELTLDKTVWSKKLFNNSGSFN